MAQYPTDLASIELARKYNYVLNDLTKTWSDSSFAWTNFNRMAASYTNGGRQAIIALETAGPGSFRFGNADTLLAEPGTATYKEATLDFTVFSVGAQFNYVAQLAAEGNKLSFINLKAKTISDSAEMMGLRMSHAIFLAPNNAVARLKTDNGGGNWTLYAEGETGSGGTYGTKYMFENGYSSFSANITAGNTVAEVNTDAISTGIDRVANTVTFVGTPGSPVTNLAVDNYVMWGSKDRTSKGYGMNGLPVIVNDGVDYAVFEGRNRTLAANIDWRSEVSRGFGTGNIEREIITRCKNLEIRRPGKKTDVVWYGLSTQQMHFEQMATQRRTMMPVTDMKTGPVFTGGFQALALSYGNRMIPIMADREYPDTAMYGLNWDSLGKAFLPNGEPRWLEESQMGMQWIQLQETLNFEAHLVGVGQLASKDPGVNWVTVGIEPEF